jgi:hypothetical protein
MISIISGTDAAICTAVIVAQYNGRFSTGVLGVSVPNFTQPGGHADFYVLLFGVMYLARCDFAMNPTKEQRVCIKFCANLGKVRWRPWQSLDTRSGKKSWAVHGWIEWHARFRAGWTFIEDDQHTGRPISCTTTDTVAKLQQLARKDRRRTIQDLADEIGIGYGSC